VRGAAAFRVGGGPAVDDRDVQPIPNLDGQRPRVVRRQVVRVLAVLEEVHLEQVNAPVAEPLRPVEEERQRGPPARRQGVDRLDRVDPRQGVGPARRRPGHQEFDLHLPSLDPPEVLHRGLHHDRRVGQGERVGQRQVRDGQVLRVGPGEVDHDDVGLPLIEQLPPRLADTQVGRRRGLAGRGDGARPRRPLEVGEDRHLPPRVGPRRPPQDVADRARHVLLGGSVCPLGENAGDVGRPVRDAQAAELGDDLLRLVRRPLDHRLRTRRQRDQREPVAGVRVPDERFRLLDRVLEPRAAVLGPGGHAQGRVDDEDVVRPRRVRHQLWLPRPDPLPQLLRLVGHRDHRK
jgi:hypothetical protein